MWGGGGGAKTRLNARRSLISEVNLCSCMGLLASYLVGNHEDKFSVDGAHVVCVLNNCIHLILCWCINFTASQHTSGHINFCQLSLSRVPREAYRGQFTRSQCISFPLTDLLHQEHRRNGHRKVFMTKSS